MRLQAVGLMVSENILSVSLLMVANDSCGMASLDTSSMHVGMIVVSQCKSLGAICKSSNPII